MALEIAIEGKIFVRRPNRDFLMKVRAGEFDYEYLQALAEEKMEKVRAAYATCNLPDEPSYDLSVELLLEMRAALR